MGSLLTPSEWPEGQIRKLLATVTAVVLVAVALVATMPSGAAADPTAPGAPTGLSGSWRSGEVSLSWQPPKSDGGSAVTGYEYRYHAVDGDAPEAWTPLAAGQSMSTLGGLTDDVAYRFELRAVNSVGSGASDTIDVMPLATFAIAAFGLSTGGSTGVADTTAACGATLPDDSLAGSGRDRAVLEVLYSCTDGANWYRNTNWQSSLPLGQWSGVNVDGDGRVTTLELSTNWMVGNLPAVIGELSRLTVLKLDRNYLSGTLPASLGNLSELTELDLSRNQLTGNLPAVIGELSRLTILKLDRNNLSGTLPASLGSLSDLAELDLSRNSFSGGLPSQLGDLANLKTLELSWNEISGEIPSSLGALTAVTAIYLHMNELTGPIPTQFGSLSKLEVLELSHNVTMATAGIDGAIPAELGQLSNLKRLSVGWNDLSGSIPPELGRLSNLESLFLVLNRLSGTIPSELGQLTNLKSLRLTGNSLSGQIPHSLGGLPQLHTAHFSENQLSGCLPVGLESVTRWPDFSFLQVAGAGGERSQMPWCGLKRLSVGGHVLEPRFATSTTSYDVEVGHNIEQVTIEYEADDEAAKVAIKDENGDAISDSDDQTAGFQVTLTSLQVGDTLTLSLSVTATSPSPQAVDYALAVSRLANRSPVIGSENSSATGLPTIGGEARVGQTLTADVSGISDDYELDNAVFSYQWLRNDAEIAGATGETYTLVAEDEGETIKVKVSFTDDAGNEESLTSDPTMAVTPEAGPLAGFSLVADGTGGELVELVEGVQVVTGEYSATLFAIRANLVPSKTVGSVRFELVRDDVTVTTGGGKTESYAPYSLYGDEGENKLTGEPLPEGSYLLTATAHAERNAQGDVLGRLEVSFTVVETAPAQEQEEPPHAPNSSATGQPTIGGEARVGRTLTADTSGISDDDQMDNAVFSYQWLRGNAEIAGATGATYTVVEADEGRTIEVKVSFTDDAGHAESLTSDPTGAVTPDPGPLTTFRVVDASSDPDTPLGTPVDGGTLTLAGPAGDSYGIRVNTDSNHDDHDDIHKVVLALSGGKDVNKPDWEAPYSLYGDDGQDNLGGGDLPAGGYQLKATAYRANGDVLGTLQISFEVAYAALAQQQTEPPPAQNSRATGAPTIDGTAQVGQTLTVDTSDIDDDDGLDSAAFSYQWLRNDGSGDTEIQDATSSSYTLVEDDVGRTVNVKVSFTDDQGHAESLTSDPTGTVEAKPNTRATGAPTIGGEARVGETLTADTSDIDDDDGLDTAVFTYQWLRGDAEIAGGTDATYTLVESDEGRTIKVTVSFTDEAGHEESLTSDSTGAVEAKPNSSATEVPTIGGEARVGETLTADVSGISDDDDLTQAVFGYQWLRDDTDIPGATGQTYTLVESDEGRTIKVTVSFTDDRGHTETVTSDPTGAVEAKPNTQATGAPTIDGEARVGETLTADTSGIDDDDGLDNVTFAYQWTRSDGGSDSNIKEATGSSYTLVKADVGSTIKVKVSFTDDAGHAESLTSDPTGAVEAKPNTQATGVPTIDGEARVGETLTADVSTIDDDDGLDTAAFTYQWVRSDGGTDTDITGANGSSYTLTEDDEGRTVKVKVSFTDDAGHQESLTSDPTGAVAAKPNTRATGRPTIGGEARVGQTLTADVSGISDDDDLTNAVFSYQWLRSDGNGDTEIQDATSSSYTLTGADEGRTVKVKVSFTDEAGNAESLTSDPTGVVAAAETVPGRPQDLAGEASAPGIKLTWSAPSGSTVTQYVVYRGELENGSMNGRPMMQYATIDAAGDAMEYTDANVKAGVEYRYRVAAVNSSGESKKSGWVDIRAVS